MKKEKTLLGLTGYAALISILLIIISHLFWNLPYTYGFGDEKIAFLAKHKDLFIAHEPDTGVVVVNVSYDKVLVPQIDERRHIAVGDRAIVDRRDMAAFLKYLKETDSYKYIVCDVAFDARYKTEYDEELYSTIASMRDIAVVAADSIPEQIDTMAVFGGYRIKKTGDDFLKYSCYIDGRENVALKMWKDLTGGECEEIHWGVSMNGKRCLNSFVPEFRFIMYDELEEVEDLEKKSTNGNRYHSVVNHLGSEIVDLIQYGGMENQFKDKIILIGSWFDDDQHDTLVGGQPGISIIYNSYLALVHGDNHISFWVYFLLFALFWIESMFLLRKIYAKQLRAYADSHQNCLSDLIMTTIDGINFRNKTVKLLGKAILYFLSYTTPIFIVVAIIFFTKGLYVNVFIIGLSYAFMDSIISEVFLDENLNKKKDESVLA